MVAKRFKVSAIIPRSDGAGDYFKEIGSAYENKDQSFNAYLDFLPLNALGPKGLKLHIRELTPEDIEKRRASRGTSTGPQLSPPSAASEDIPF